MGKEGEEAREIREERVRREGGNYGIEGQEAGP